LKALKTKRNKIMVNLKDLIPQVLAEMEARKSTNQSAEAKQLELFGRVYELYNEERQELHRIFNDFEKSFVDGRRIAL
jgi:hypothetical protein